MQSVRREDSLVKDVLQRSLRKSLVAASPASLQNSPAVIHNSPAASSPSALSLTAVEGDASRKPLRSILHNTGSNSDTVDSSDSVGTEQLREKSGGSKKTR